MDLESTPLTARLLLSALLLPLPLGIAIASIQTRSILSWFSSIESSVALAICLAALVALGAACYWVSSRLLRRHRIVLGSNSIEIATSFYTRRLAVAEFDLQRARVVDLRERTELKPLFKTNGMRLPGFASGWFRLRNRSKAFVATTGGSRVLWLPTRNGYDLLLQPRHPKALLDRLREMAAQM